MAAVVVVSFLALAAQAGMVIVQAEVAMGAVEAALAATQFLAFMAAQAAAAVGGLRVLTLAVALYWLGLLAVRQSTTAAFLTRFQIAAQFTEQHNEY